MFRFRTIGLLLLGFSCTIQDVQAFHEKPAKLWRPDAGLSMNKAGNIPTPLKDQQDRSVFTDADERPYPTSVENHPLVAGFIHAFQSDNKAIFERKRAAWSTTFRIIDQVFSDYGIPESLKYLCVIESGLDVKAVSVKGASGPWQFMPSAARAMGLTVSHNVDERNDLLKSTAAAARLLDQMYQDFGDWLLVIAAYNAGPGRVRAAIKRAQTNDYWTVQYFLPTETRHHVKKFMGVRYLMEEVLIPEAEQSRRMAETKLQIDASNFSNMETLTISGKYHSQVITRYLSMDPGWFRILNPAFDNSVATDEYQLRLPAPLMEQFRASRLKILAESLYLLLNEKPIDRNRGPVPIQLPSTQAMKMTQEIRLRS